MPVYRDDTLELPAGKSIGDPATAAELGLTSITGAPVYVDEGFQKSNTSVQYPQGASGTLTASFDAHVWERIAIKTKAPPVGGYVQMVKYETATGVPYELRALTTGQWELRSVNRTVVTPVSLCTNNWFHVGIEVDSTGMRGWLRVFDRYDEHIVGLPIEIGGQPKTKRIEGALMPLGGSCEPVKMSRSYIGTDPLYLGKSADNVIHIVMDDAPEKILRHSAWATYMQEHGWTFTNHISSTPLCAPARSCMYSGLFSYHTGVVTNGNATNLFREGTNYELTSVFTRASALGVHTSHIGKYMHGLNIDGDAGSSAPYPAKYVPWGIDWALLPADGAYGQFDYRATKAKDGVATFLNTEGGQALEGDYLTDVISAYALEFIDSHTAARAGQPFFQHLAPYTGHNNAASTDPEGSGTTVFPPAPRDRPAGPNRPAYWGTPQFPATGDLGPLGPNIPQPDPPDLGDYNVHPSDKPAWYRPELLGATTLANMHGDWLDVIRQMQSLDDMIGALFAKLEAKGLHNKTWIVLTSDNGYHRGEHGIPKGKGVPYDSDCRLPLVVYPPGGLNKGKTCDAPVQFVDLLPTFLDMLGAAEPKDVDGRSFLGFMTGNPPDDWRATTITTYSNNEVAGWEAAKGTGVAPDWYMLRSNFGDPAAPTGHLYITYDPQNPGVPDADRGEAYADRWQLVNLWPEIPGYRAWPIQAQLQALLTAAPGEKTWVRQLQPFSLTGGAFSIGNPVYVADGVDLEDPAGRWGQLFEDFEGPSVPEKTVDDIGGAYGLLVADGQFDQAMSSRPAYMRLPIKITDLDGAGRSGGHLLLAENQSALLSVLDKRGTFILGERPVVGLPVEWQTRARALGEIRPTFHGSGKRIEPLLQLVDGVWLSPEPYTWGFQFSGPTVETPQHVTPLAGSSGPIRGAIVRVRGPFGRFAAVDQPSGYEMSCDRTTSAAEWVLVDTRNWVAKVVTTDTWDMTGGEDVSHKMETNQATGDLWVLHPTAHNGNPFDRRVYVVLSGAGRSSSTYFEIRAHRAKRA